VAGEVSVPGDKSISHRAALIGAIADGATDIDGFLEGDDCRATLAAIAAMGVGIARAAPGRIRVEGVGRGGLEAPAQALDVGNSGTSMRLLAGILAAQAFDSVLVGDASLMRRPMRRIADPLVRMGADIATQDGLPPLRIKGGRALRGCDHDLATPSAQVKSALLLAGLDAAGTTRVREPGASRDHTERMLGQFGVSVLRTGDTVGVAGGARPVGTRIDVPGDFSSAAFLVVAGIVAGRGPLVIRGVGVNPTRTALLDILKLMGADVRLHSRPGAGAEPVADIEVRPGRLRGIEVPPGLVPAALDEMPVLFAAAALADGDTVVRGAAELRVKESDRIAAMAEGLAALGVGCERLVDGLAVRGGPVSGGVVDSRGDHRVAMAFAVLGARARDAIQIRDVQNVATSFPGFAATARAAGLGLVEAA
jgi:3-phosphoshikimate 1-carboxyvinyltransferase